MIINKTLICIQTDDAFVMLFKSLRICFVGTLACPTGNKNGSADGIESRHLPSAVSRAMLGCHTPAPTGFSQQGGKFLLTPTLR